MMWKPLTQEQLNIIKKLPDDEKRQKKIYWLTRREQEGVDSGYVLDDPKTTYEDKHLNLSEAFEFFENYWHAWAYKQCKG